MRTKPSPMYFRVWKKAAATVFLATLVSIQAQTSEDQSLISTNLSDAELIEFSKAEPRFAAEALPLAQARICVYAEGAKTSHGQAFISDLRIPRAVLAPGSFCLTNANSAVKLYLGFATPVAPPGSESAAAWTELGLAILERANAVLHHYYLAVEYRKGHEPALRQLREQTRGLAGYLSKRAGTVERLTEMKARYAALWFERCDEVLPVYAEVIGEGARGVVRDALVMRPADLPLFTGWSWDERKKADSVQKAFIEKLSASSNGLVRIEGLLLALARTRTDRAYARTFTNVLEAIALHAETEGTRTAYVNVIKELLHDRHSKDLTDKTRNDLRKTFEARYAAAAPTNASTVSLVTNASVAVVTSTNSKAAAAASANVAQAKVEPTNSVKSGTPARPGPPAVAAAVPQKKPAPSWKLLLTESEIRYWETMPLPEIRSVAKSGDPLANYYVFLKLHNSDSSALVTEADAALEHAYKAGLPQAELDHANREQDAEERFHWTKKAASTGYPAAQLALGKLHLLGHGTTIDLDRGLSLVRASYDLKVPEAEAVLAELYASGIGEPRAIRERPENLFFTAARNNQPAAMLELHHRYLEGYAVARDQLEACRWLVNVGLHDKTALSKYLDESGKSILQPSVDLDRFAKTLAVYAQAIIYKQPEAITHVADWYATGSIGRKSSLRAYALLSLAGKSEKVTPEAVEKVKSALTPQQLKTAELLMTQWQRIQPDLLKLDEEG